MAFAGMTSLRSSTRAPVASFRRMLCERRRGRRHTLQRQERVPGQRSCPVILGRTRPMLKITDFGRHTGNLTELPAERLIPLPARYDTVDAMPPRKALSVDALAKCDASLDGFLAVGMPKPQTAQEEQA